MMTFAEFVVMVFLLLATWVAAFTLGYVIHGYRQNRRKQDE